MRITHPRTGVVVETDPFEPPAGEDGDVRFGASDAVRALSLSQYRTWTLAGRRFHIAPLGYLDGQEVVRMQAEMFRIGKGATTDADAVLEQSHQVVALLDRVVALANRLLIPVSRVGRLRKRLHRVPFIGRLPMHGATEAEVGAVLSFFIACRMAAVTRVMVDRASPN